MIMDKKERFLKLIKICERAEKECKDFNLDAAFGKRVSRMMDLQSADERFNLRLDEFLEADNVDFYHDVFGIWGESSRETYPCTFGLFVPRFAAVQLKGGIV